MGQPMPLTHFMMMHYTGTIVIVRNARSRRIYGMGAGCIRPFEGNLRKEVVREDDCNTANVGDCGAFSCALNNACDDAHTEFG